MTTTPMTRWTLIERAKGTGPEARVALSELVQRYNLTIRGHIRRWGCPPGVPPEDVQQDFLLGFTRHEDCRHDLGRFDPKLGKFRHFLAKAVQNHMRNTWIAWKGPTRGNTVTVYPEWIEVASDETPEDLCLCSEALDILRHALAVHRARATNGEHFDQLKRFLPGGIPEAGALADVAKSMGITANHVGVKINVTWKKHVPILCRVVADGLRLDPGTDPVTSPTVRRELGELLSALCNATSAISPFG